MFNTTVIEDTQLFVKLFHKSLQSRAVYIFNYKMFHQEASVETIKIINTTVYKVMKTRPYKQLMLTHLDSSVNEIIKKQT